MPPKNLAVMCAGCPLLRENQPRIQVHHYPSTRSALARESPKHPDDVTLLDFAHSSPCSRLIGCRQVRAFAFVSSSLREGMYSFVLSARPAPRSPICEMSLAPSPSGQSPAEETQTAWHREDLMWIKSICRQGVDLHPQEPTAVSAFHSSDPQLFIKVRRQVTASHCHHSSGTRRCRKMKKRHLLSTAIYCQTRSRRTSGRATTYATKKDGINFSPCASPAR